MFSGLRDPHRWVLPAVIEERADLHGDQPFVTMVGGETLSYRALRDDALRVAGMLSAMGVAPGDRVALLLPSGLDFLRAWAGVGRFGGVAVILNNELTGAFLAHPLADSAAPTLIIDEALLPRLDAVPSHLPALERILVTGHGGSFDAWRTVAPLDVQLPAAKDIACIMYTSGTTGAPKGVLMPHAHCFLFGLGVIDNLGVTADDHYYVCLPLSHANGLLMQLGAALIAGAGATVRERFSASGWLEDIRACGATVTHTLGAISAFVVAQPCAAADRDHQLRILLGAPNHPDHERAWRERFGIAEVLGGYGMTEVNIPLYGDRTEARPGTCGRPYERYFEVDVRDAETGLPVRQGEVGEIVVRPRVANGFMAGYNDLPQQTVEAWRDLWFHTGDAGRQDADGHVVFVDRIKECIRRRGENISATDIETSIATLDGIAEIAAYAVASDLPGGEDEIMLSIVRAPGASLSPGDILNHARARMPRYAQPRFVSFVDELPRTATEKVRKADLRAAGVIDGTIDLTRL